MAIKTIYVLPGDMLEIRVCNPVFEMGANIQAWKESTRPDKVLVTVNDCYDLQIGNPMVSVFVGTTRENRRQLLPIKDDR